jgi:prepilin-type N-terminal cleavage/methylation domain-containing protein/prepilin-type processing-associated H-X9-DG protein
LVRWHCVAAGKFTGNEMTSFPIKPCGGASRRRGFTLVELLVVVAIIAVLTTVSLAAARNMRAGANKVKCLSNQRQIGTAVMAFAAENNRLLPQTTHTTGSRRKEESWIYQLSPYFGDSPGKIDEVRVCPADPPQRQERIRRMNATSYALNDLVFDSPTFSRLANIGRPEETILLFILSENRAPSVTRDHIHGSEWSSWAGALSDIEPDRHRSGAQAKGRTEGSANYLYADGSARNIPAKVFKSLFDKGVNPAQPRQD